MPSHRSRSLTRLSPWLLAFGLGVAPMVLASSQGCSSVQDVDTGSAEFIGTTAQALSAADVTRVRVTVSGPGIATPITHDLVRVSGQWRGTIGAIPVGVGRNFHGDAYDAGGTVVYRGDAPAVTITKGTTALVSLLLQQAQAPVPFQNSAPRIDSMTASSNAVSPGDVVSLAATAHDPDAEALTYAWTATGGTFTNGTSLAAQWTAPATEGSYNLTIRATDPKSAVAATTFTVNVAAANARGKAAVSTILNTWPEVALVNASATRINIGESTSLTITASDADSDVLQYAWTATCAGTFNNPSAQAPSFTIAAPLPAGNACALVASVTDGRGGTNTGQLSIATGAAATGLPPVIDTTFQSSDTAAAGAPIVLRVSAHDPESTSLTFAWAASSGTLGAPATTGGTSEVSWAAPAVFGANASITATVTDGSGASTVVAFGVAPAVAVATSCATPGDGVNNCGAGAESCCTSPLVTGGTFSRTYDNVTYTDPQYVATVSDFRLDKYEVTVGRFRKFVDAVVAGWTPAAGSGKHTHLNGGNGLAASGGGFEPGWDTAWNTNLPNAKATWDSASYLACDVTYQTWTSATGANERRPINCVNWYQSTAFCIWDGGFLPSEAEWNYAAAGGNEHRVFPWSSPPSSTTVNDTYAIYSPTSAGGTQNVGSKSPVGNGRYGQADLLGNVYEWAADFYSNPYSEILCTNCASSTPGGVRVVRGGSAFNNAVPTAARGAGTAANPHFILGARCARTP
jgi:formylglycine-generating enzyme required for sulfatase activity